MGDINQTAPQKTVQLDVAHLVPGMELARDVVSSEGMILIGEGTLLSRHTIDKLKHWQIPTVTVTNEAISNPIINPKVRQFVNSYNKSVSVVQQAFETMRADEEVPLETFAATATEISSHVQSAGNVIDRLYDLPVCDDATYQHSVNVSVIATLVATWLGYPLPVVNAVALAGLLHDVGKSQLPVEFLNRPDKLSQEDYEHYKRHAAYGFELVKNLPDLGESIKAAVIQHHERTDGSGYPLRLTGDKIHPYARIVAIADLYDEALTINREPTVVYSPYSGLEKLNDEKYRLDPQMCLAFTSRMLNYLSGNTVALSDGRQGRVVYLNQFAPSRSMVQLTDGTVIDLDTEPHLRIHYVIR